MKKLFLVAAIGVAGVMSANTITSNDVETINPKNDKEVIIEDVVKSEESSEVSAKYDQPIYYEASCGLWVQTTQPTWGWAEALEWAAKIEENYC